MTNGLVQHLTVEKSTSCNGIKLPDRMANISNHEQSDLGLQHLLKHDSPEIQELYDTLHVIVMLTIKILTAKQCRDNIKLL